MTVQNLIVKNIASGNGSTTQWPFTFACPVDHPEYIKVYIKGASGEATATNDFSVNMTTKYVTYPVTGNVLASGEKIIIARELPLHQILNLVNQGPFYAEDLEVTYDELVMMVQQLNEQLQRSLKVGIDIDQEREIDITIPVPTNDSNYGIRITKNGFELVRDPQDAYDAAVAQNTAAIATMNAIRDENVATTTALKNQAEAAKSDAQNAQNKAQAWAEENAGTTPSLIDGAKSAKQWGEMAQAWAEEMATQRHLIPLGSQSAKQWAALAEHQFTGNFPYVTPEMYGAYGDGLPHVESGVDVESAAIQSAIDSGKVVLFTGNYYVTTTLNVYSNTVIIGRNNNCVETPSKVNVGPLFKVYNANNVIIRDFKIKSTNDKSVTYSSSTYLSSNVVAINAFYITNLFIKNVEFENIAYGVKVDEDTNGVSNNNNVNVLNCKFGNGVGMPLYLGGIDGCIVDSCNIYCREDTSRLAHHIYCSDSSKNHIYRNNYFSGGTGHAIQLYSAKTSAVQPQNISIINNKMNINHYAVVCCAKNIIIRGNDINVSKAEGAGAFQIMEDTTVFLYNNYVCIDDGFVFKDLNGANAKIKSQGNKYYSPYSIVYVKNTHIILNCDELYLTAANVRFLTSSANCNCLVEFVNCRLVSKNTNGNDLMRISVGSGIVLKVFGCIFEQENKVSCVVWASENTYSICNNVMNNFTGVALEITTGKIINNTLIS